MSKSPTTKQRLRWYMLRELGCIVCRRAGYEDMPASIHHCETGAGGRKDHDRVLPLCPHHHQGAQGIHRLSRPIWEDVYGTEQFLMEVCSTLLGE